MEKDISKWDDITPPSEGNAVFRRATARARAAATTGTVAIFNGLIVPDCLHFFLLQHTCERREYHRFLSKNFSPKAGCGAEGGATAAAVPVYPHLL
jgi:hypothetical protein